jgi:pyridoxal phosphate enzyme (YggS family)
MNDQELKATLSTRLAGVREQIVIACQKSNRNPVEVTLIAVTKTVSNRVVAAMHELGVRDFGENRPQELWKKAAASPSAHWHLIGHLQRNKIEKTIPLTVLNHSVDSERLLLALSDFGTKVGKPVPVLLEFNCSREEAKGGFDPEQLSKLGELLPSLTGVRVEGLMTMAAYHDDPEHSRPAFAELRSLSERLRVQTGLPLPWLSMGMSNDFEIAIEEGATHVRIGTTLFQGLESVE